MRWNDEAKFVAGRWLAGENAITEHELEYTESTAEIDECEMENAVARQLSVELVLTNGNKKSFPIWNCDLSG